MKRTKKSIPHLNMLRGQLVSVMTTSNLKGTDEDDSQFEQPLAFEGLFIFADEHDIYLNTANDNENAFNTILNRNKYSAIEIVFKDETKTEDKQVLN